MQLVNPFQHSGKWYKANLHTHTLNCGDDIDIAKRIEQYKTAGFNILAITDHDQAHDVSGLSSDDFLVISGTELHPPCHGWHQHHFICLNVPADFSTPLDTDANTVVKMVKQAGGEVIYAHPYWNGHTIKHLLDVEDYLAIEVFNSTCTISGRAYSSVHWDQLLNAGRIVSGIAADDTHIENDLFKGWIHIKAAELSVKAVMEALRTGCFYSSCGPAIEDFHIENSTAKIKTSPVTEIHFIGQGKFYGRSFYADNGDLLTNAELALADGFEYLRAEIIDQNGKHTWTNPIIFKSKNNVCR